MLLISFAKAPWCGGRVAVQIILSTIICCSNHLSTIIRCETLKVSEPPSNTWGPSPAHDPKMVGLAWSGTTIPAANMTDKRMPRACFSVFV
jgi:hypothetical protein